MFMLVLYAKEGSGSTPCLPTPFGTLSVMKWSIPPDIKIYEALGAVADRRVKVEGNRAKVYSSSGNKFYDVEYDADSGSIMANDNGSYWKGYLGYPAIAYLMSLRVLTYNSKLGSFMQKIAWKDINTKYKNDFEKTLDFILKDLPVGIKQELQDYVFKVQGEIVNLDLSYLGKKTLPPQGY